MGALFGFTIFASATLLFVVQPLVGKLLLPHLGGSPAVWTTCLLFFQSTLLVGYAWAHGLARARSLRLQVGLHAALLVTAALTLPLALPQARLTVLTGGAEPVTWLLATVALVVGLPFLALSSHAPLLQAWFARSTHKRAADPYFLYALSNAGSVGALIALPLVLEPAFDIDDLTVAWSVGLVVVAALVVAAGMSAVSREREPSSQETPQEGSAASWRPGGRQALVWLALTAVPSSHMVGVTEYLATDLASVPLLWIVPLALYLLSFVIAFSRFGERARALATRVLPFGLLALVFLLVVRATEPLVLLAVLHLAVFFLAAVALHGRLVVDRPPAAGLTAFYFVMSVGGALGGLVNAVLAPLVFDTRLEYPLVLAAAAALLGGALRPGKRSAPLGDVLVALGLFGVAMGVGAALLSASITGPLARLVMGAPLVVAFAFVRRPPRFAAGLLGVYLGASAMAFADVNVLVESRSFFGVLRVVEAKDGSWREIRHGNTVHGRQWAPPFDGVPGAYYHPAGPAGDVFRAHARRGADASVGVVGLGAGALAAYARPGESWRFYELDPGVARTASDTHLFTFLAHAPRPGPVIEVGDGRLLLSRADDDVYSLLVIDAFSSGAIPLHLLTREAVAEYARVTGPRGVVAMHVSNRYLDLEPAIGRLAQDAGLVGRARDDLADDGLGTGREQSRWLVVMREDAALSLPSTWRPLRVGDRALTDSFSNVLSLVN